MNLHKLDKQEDGICERGVIDDYKSQKVSHWFDR
jgi:hypothetical protein